MNGAVLLQKTSDDIDFTPGEVVGCFRKLSMEVSSEQIDVTRADQMPCMGGIAPGATDVIYDVSKPKDGPAVHVMMIVQGVPDGAELCVNDRVQAIDDFGTTTITGLWVTRCQHESNDVAMYTLESAPKPAAPEQVEINNEGEVKRISMLYRLLQWAALQFRK